MSEKNTGSLKLEEDIRKNLQKTSEKPIEDIYKDLSTSIDGLEEKEAARRLDKYGLNEVLYEKRKPWYMYLLRSFFDPFILILLFIVFISYFTDIAFDWITRKTHLQ